MHVRNVAAELIEDLQEIRTHLTNYPKATKVIDDWIPVIDISKKFLLPEGGLLLNDSPENYEIEDRTLIHLPFDVCLFIFPAETKSGEKLYCAVGCIENDKGIIVQSFLQQRIVHNSLELKWVPEDFYTYIPFDPSLHADYAGLNGIAAQLVRRDMYDEQLTDEELQGTGGLALRPVTQVLKIMQCSNITSVPIAGTGTSDNVNKKRIANGKKPLYEYRQLAVDMGGVSQSSSGVHYSSGGGHKRQHFRRGHIRHCHSGIKVWVQACIVGSGEFGQVDKEYKVKKAA
jgi:hypothetical protein